MKPTQHTNVSIIVFSLLIILLSVSTLMIREFVIKRSKDITPDAKSLKSPLIPPDGTTEYADYEPPPFPKDPSKLNVEEGRIYTFAKGDFLYYIKNGNIVKASLKDSKNVSTGVVVDAKDEILAFDVSPDENFIAYSIQLNKDSDDTTFNEANGDNVVVRDLKAVSDLYVYSDSKGENMEVRDIMFSKDSKKLFFSSNSIMSYDFQTKSLKKYLTKEKNGFCSIYFLNDVSWDNRNLLVRNACYEGSSQLVLDLVSGKTVGKFENGYVGGGDWALGFITNTLILGYDNVNYSQSRYNGEKVENDKIIISSYSLSGNAIKKISESDRYPRFLVRADEFNENPDKSKFYFLSITDGGLDDKNQIFELGVGTLALKPSEVKKNLVVVDHYDNYSKDNNTDLIDVVWLTDLKLENPVLVDTLKSKVSNGIKLKSR